MAIRNILKSEDPSLMKKSREIVEFDKRLHILLDDMKETLLAANGLGIAAPQVGVLRRAVLVIDIVEDPEDPENVEEHVIELVNPEIIDDSDEQSGREGCLSVPGVYGIVTRPRNVKVRAHDRFGKSFEIKCSELTARAVCHEVDHLNGVVFTSIAERILTPEELEEFRAEREEES